MDLLANDVKSNMVMIAKSIKNPMIDKRRQEINDYSKIVLNWSGKFEPDEIGPTIFTVWL